MRVITLLLGSPSQVTPKDQKKAEIAKNSQGDNATNINRLTAARMRNALHKEVIRLERTSVQDFRQLLELQGQKTNHLDDLTLTLLLREEIHHLRALTVKLLQQDIISANTPIIIAGTTKGALGIATKILGPTTVASWSPLSINVWWNCQVGCKIDSIHFYNANQQIHFRP
ncbi:hypothetical protein [Alkalimonas amylolytica]|uniref:Uncharacterized protein n=1 Tax=Alkalimonas amylolytica TaxID=152573 RepID=A0A1H4D800_ALKAM|nr:hypothetical protein [Alkalimonas amylolytica]SEA68943.1 hypothetical protein SAMN04488051_105121 [Alkalimonas amylolytica]